jgi:hypothetical protein
MLECQAELDRHGQRGAVARGQLVRARRQPGGEVLAVVLGMEPPASDARGSRLSPTSTRTCSAGTPSASAAIRVRAVRAPVPMSAAATRTTKPPFVAVAVAWDGRRLAG